MSITGTLIIQMIVFLILVGFTMKYISVSYTHLTLPTSDLV